ncbi:MAG: PAS domain S-box protein [Sulfuritalea sp.]|nr:PAS domain S-box protein [Sulfuritalea sp.]
MTAWTRLNSFLEWRSLKTRVTLLTLAVFLIGIWTMSLYASRMLRKETEHLLASQQISTVALLATQINQDLVDRIRGLETVTRNISPGLLGHPEALQAFLVQLPVLHNLFNGGIVAIAADGTAIAEAPFNAGRIGVNYMDIAEVAAALKQGKAGIGKPVMGKKLRAPVFGIAVPIRDAHGKVIGALSGVINLGKPNFLDRIAQSPYGKTGGFMLVAKQQRQVVTATDRRMIMAALPAVGSNPLIDSFVQGYEGSGVIVNPLGTEVLGSAKGIPLTDWYIAVALPTEEAFAPLKILQQRILLATLMLTLLVGVLTWWLLKRQLSPLFDTAKTLATLAKTGEHPRSLPVARQDEIGELIGGFNRLLETLAQREAILRESEARYRTFFELSPDAILVHRDSTVIFANARAAKLFHAESPTALIGQDWHPLFEPEYWEAIEQRIAMLVDNKVSHLAPLERRFPTLGGDALTMEATGSRIIFNGRPAVLSVFRDITERKQAEEQRLADARRQRDTLVREVHHRIKNNLQSVAGLLQRELGRFLELDPRLETAIGQVNAIAVVHGLQSASSDEAIGLCDSVCSICASVAELSQRPVRFHAEEEPADRPVRIETGEAVSLALVLNELILNAVKHSPPDGAAPTVSFSADDSSAQLVIRNALAAAPEFDIDTGTGLGTGLHLVRSLLPDRGAQLTHELDTENFMLTRLKLTTPVIACPPRKRPR